MPHKDIEVRRAYHREYQRAKANPCLDCGGTVSDKRHQRCASCSNESLSGEHAPGWKGDNVKNKEAGRQRAQKLYKLPDNCERCGSTKSIERHHKDENTLNNAPENIAFLCRKCHMIEDGRLEKLRGEEAEITDLICAVCAKSFSVPTSRLKRTPNIRFCSRACGNIGTGPVRKRRIKLACANCGKNFERKPSRVRGVRKPCCSQTCGSRLLGRK